jgi:hypothetical protein
VSIFLVRVFPRFPKFLFIPLFRLSYPTALTISFFTSSLHYLFSVSFLADPDSLQSNGSASPRLPNDIPHANRSAHSHRSPLLHLHHHSQRDHPSNRPLTLQWAKNITKMGLRRLLAVKLGEFMTWKESDSICTSADEASWCCGTGGRRGHPS